MIDDPQVLTNVRPVAIEVPAHLPAAEAPAPPTEEQARLADDVFTRRNAESDMVMGLIGMQAGILLLHDLTVETLTPPALEADEAKRPRPRKPGPDGAK